LPPIEPSHTIRLYTLGAQAKIYKRYNSYKNVRRTTIAVSPEVKERLQRLGRKGESYDEILRRLLSMVEEELELIDEVYRRIERTPRKDYVRLEDL
jgi:predicted CopG family antitoxin